MVTAVVLFVLCTWLNCHLIKTRDFRFLSKNIKGATMDVLMILLLLRQWVPLLLSSTDYSLTVFIESIHRRYSSIDQLIDYSLTVFIEGIHQQINQLTIHWQYSSADQSPRSSGRLIIISIIQSIPRKYIQFENNDTSPCPCKSIRFGTVWDTPYNQQNHWYDSLSV